MPIPAVVTWRVLVAAAWVGAHAVGEAQQPPAAPPPGVACRVSSDPTFAITPEKPARVGGGALYVAARERAYLSALRGPTGQPIAYKRLGQARAPGRDGILDQWQVTAPDLPAPMTIFLDAYHYDEPLAPAGFTCVRFNLGPPPIDGFLATELLLRLAIEQGRTREFRPISLDADGSARHGVAFDRFRLVARAAASAAAAGAPLDPQKLPREVAELSLVLVAYPRQCDTRAQLPSGIQIVAPGAAPPRDGELVTGEALARVLPGLAMPAGSLVVRFPPLQLRPPSAVRITYAGEACPTGSADVTLPVTFVGAQGVTMPQGTLSGDETPDAPVWLQAIVDLDGLLQQATYIGGPESRAERAKSVLKSWKAEPARLNGTPVVFDTLALIGFQPPSR